MAIAGSRFNDQSGMNSPHPPDLLGCPPEGPLFHYTTAEGLEGIVTSRELWATSTYDLRDKSELDHATDLAQQVLWEHAQFLTSSKEARRVLRYVQENVKQARAGAVYVFSFSLRGNRLSQWREYCPRGGYALGFARGTLSQIATRHHCRLGPCIYDRTQQRTLLTQTVRAFVCRLGTTCDDDVQSPATEPDRALTSFAAQLDQLAPFFKHPCFEEEAEWRLVSDHIPQTSPLIRRHDRNGVAVAYVPLGVAEDAATLVTLPCVWVGPRQDQTVATNRLHALFQEHRFRAATYYQSEIPE